jgi:hypothetical protein
MVLNRIQNVDIEACLNVRINLRCNTPGYADTQFDTTYCDANSRGTDAFQHATQVPARYATDTVDRCSANSELPDAARLWQCSKTSNGHQEPRTKIKQLGIGQTATADLGLLMHLRFCKLLPLLLRHILVKPPATTRVQYNEQRRNAVLPTSSPSCHLENPFTGGLAVFCFSPTTLVHRTAATSVFLDPCFSNRPGGRQL